MAITSGFFNSISGDRVYNADQMSQYFHGLISNGVVANLGDEMQVAASSGMTVNVLAGRAYINGKWIYNDSAAALTITAANAALPRWSAVVARLDVTGRQIILTTKDGTAASTPTKPTATRDASTYELILAYVYVAAGATAIAQADISDTRPDNNVCGWVTALIDQVDTSTLFAQWEDAYATYYEETTAAFNEFMEHLTQDLAVDTYISCPVENYTKNEQTGSSASLLFSEVSGYTWQRGDIFFVDRNGLPLQYGPDYMYSGSGGNISGFVFTFNFKTGNKIGLRVLRSNIGVRT